MNLAIDTIVVPQGAEYQAVCRGLKQARRQKGDLYQVEQVKNPQVVSIPIGMNHVQQILADRVFKITKPQKVLIMGLCGSLVPQYSVGDPVLYQCCWNLDHEYLNLDISLNTIIQQKLAVDLVTGLTSDRLIYQSKEKQNLSQQYPVSVVDMEGYGYIKELQHRGISVAMLRVVSDDLAGNIPDLTKAIDQDGNLQGLSMAISLLQQPVAATRLIKGSLTGLKILQQVTYKLMVS
ncbi:MAG: phosphorylase, partial [Waterburya sp.]